MKRTLSLLLASVTLTCAQDRAALEEQLRAAIQEQDGALDEMRCLSGGVQDNLQETTEEHLYRAHFRNGLEVVTELHREDGAFSQKTYHLKDGNVFALLVEGRQPCPDPAQHRVTFTGYGFHQGKLVSWSVSSLRIAADADPDENRLAEAERDLPIPPGFDAMQKSLNRRAFDIARNLHPAVADHSLADFVDVGPPDEKPDAPTADWMPAQDTLTIPIRVWDFDSPELLSPDGRFGISWGYAKGPVDWSNLKNPEDTSIGFSAIHNESRLTDAQNDCDTFLRNAATGEILGALAVGHRGNSARYNHHEIVPYWSPSQQVIIVRETDRNWDETVRICWLNEQSQIKLNQDLLGPLGDAVLAEVRRSKHPAADNAVNQENLPIAIRGVDIDDDGSFQAKVTGDNTRQNPHWGPSDYFEAVVNGQITAAKSGSSANVRIESIQLAPPVEAP